MRNLLIDSGLVTLDSELEKNIVLRYAIPVEAANRMGNRLFSTMEREMEIIETSDIQHVTVFTEQNSLYKTLLRDKNIEDILE